MAACDTVFCASSTQIADGSQRLEAEPVVDGEELGPPRDWPYPRKSIARTRYLAFAMTKYFAFQETVGGADYRRNLTETPSDAMKAVEGKRYPDIPVPALVIFAIPHVPENWTSKSTDPAVREAARGYCTTLDVLAEKQAKALEAGVPTAHVIRLGDAHYSVLLASCFRPVWLSSSTLPFDCFQRRPTRQKSIVFVGGAEVPCKLYLHSGGVHHLQDFAHRKMFPQGCMPFAPPEKSLRRPAKHFRRPKKVSAAGHTFSADPRVFCSAALKREQFRKPKFKLQPKG